jgi:hypothetical protein
MTRSTQICQSEAERRTAQEALGIGVQSCVHRYPPIMIDVTRRVMTNVRLGVNPGLGPLNTFNHMRSGIPRAEKVERSVAATYRNLPAMKGRT